MPATYQRPKLTPAQERAVQLELFSFLIKLRTRDLISVGEAAEIMRMSPDFVRDLLQLGKLESLELKATSRKDTSPVYRITVRSLLVYIASAASLGADDWEDLLVTFIDKLDARSLGRVIELATRRRARLDS